LEMYHLFVWTFKIKKMYQKIKIKGRILSSS
jgi:hypothetical protein